VTVTLTNVNNAQKMIQINTGQKILKKLGLTTASEENLLTVLHCVQKLIELGEQKIQEGAKRTRLLAKQYEKEGFNVSHVFVAERSKALPTTKTMTNHLTLCGSASRATSNGTKSGKKYFNG
jgi:hypothetical protein